MEWLKDPKNQPKVIAGFVVIVLAVGTFLFMQMRGPGDGGETAVPPDMSATTPTSGPPGGMPPGAMPAPAGTPAPGPTPGAAPAPAPGTPSDPMAGATPGQPGAAAPAGAPKKVASALELHRGDPFLPFDWKPTKQPRYELVQIPMPGRLFNATIKPGGKDGPLPGDEPEAPQPPRRMAGILFKDRVYAIMETSGPAGYTSMVVKPGDITDDGMRVERIEPNKIVLETTRGKYRKVDVKMAASQRAPEPSMNSVDTANPNPVRPMMPRGPYGGPRGPMPMGPTAGDM